MDRGPEYGVEGGPIADENRYIEIWDLVFENYEVDNVKSKTDLHIVGELENKNIDTGAGLERTCGRTDLERGQDGGEETIF